MYVDQIRLGAAAQAMRPPARSHESSVLAPVGHDPREPEVGRGGALYVVGTDATLIERLKRGLACGSHPQLEGTLGAQGGAKARRPQPRKAVAPTLFLPPAVRLA